MTESSTLIPLQIDVGRVLEVLASQIYQSPLALLRENAQNAFDAILIRQQRDSSFEPIIDVTITNDLIRIVDNGIGMTPTDLSNHFWKAGSSSKNTAEARSAGVVGTFGIGAMANFGVASTLTVVTESAISGERTQSVAHKDTLSTSENCIEITVLEPTGSPGTEIAAEIAPDTVVDVNQAVTYIKEFVSFVQIPVLVNGQLISQQPNADSEKLSSGSRIDSKTSQLLGTELYADIVVGSSPAGDLVVELTNLRREANPISGYVLLVQGRGQLKTFRTGFGLATVSVTSPYSFGGFADLEVLEPTAGREALSTNSMQFLQTLVSNLDSYVSEIFASWPESDSNTGFMEWVKRNGRFDLCGNLKIRVEPNNKSMALSEVKNLTQTQSLPYYTGSDSALIEAHATEDQSLLVGATRQPRRACEDGYLTNYCNVSPISEGPQVLNIIDETTASASQLAVTFRVNTIVERDYFLPNTIRLGKMSHNLPILVDPKTDPISIILDPASSSFDVLSQVYDTDFEAYASLAKDYVRSIVFPKISQLVPTSTREGAEAFLRQIRTRRELFEYESGDREELSSIWERYQKGQLSLIEAAKRSRTATTRNVQVVTSSQSQPVYDVVPDLADFQALFTPSDSDQGLDSAIPPINRSEITTDAKLITISDESDALQGYRCFLALTDRTRDEKGDFFLQPHTTSVVWGGQKALFVFQHHSGTFGLYYDVQMDRVVASESGGEQFPTCTIVMKNRIFIPVPPMIQDGFIPDPGQTIRLEVRCDVLYTGTKEAGPVA